VSSSEADPETAEDLRRRLDAATAHLDPPFAVLDLQALRANTADLARRAGGTPIRVASKSVRCREVVDRTLAEPGFRGVMAYSVAEAVWLADQGADDVLVAYPSVDRTALAALVAEEHRLAAVTIMVDDEAHLDVVERAGGRGRPVRVCIDVDASLRLLRAHLGVRRSPLRTPKQVSDLSYMITNRGWELVGVMMYEAQIAGLPDTSAAVRAVKRRSAAELTERRAAVVEAAKQVADITLVNGGGTGSLEVTAADPTVTELSAGSGLYASTLFDHYRTFTPQPAAYFALPVTRRPGRRIATLFGGGYIASGPAGASRLPTPTLPAGLQLSDAEGAGEVQTPVHGRTARGLRIGDRVWFRHAKAGEMCERFDELHLIDGDRIGGTVPTYRGEGRNFG
jgi:D-serine deaminase-like pyridoxal phosphate-dependent protein